MKIEVTSDWTIYSNKDSGPREAVLFEDGDKKFIYTGSSHHRAFCECVADQMGADWSAWCGNKNSDDRAYDAVRNDGPLATKVRHGWIWQDSKIFGWNYNYTQWMI